VFVTHDQIEAMTLADRVVVMNGGHIEQIGTPDEVYHAPASLFVAGFIGTPTMNLLPARFESADTLQIGEGTVVRLRRAGGEGHVVFGIRPEDVGIAIGAAPPGCTDLPATVEVVEPLGSDTLVFTSVFGASVTARVRPEERPAPGTQIKLRVNLDRAHIFDAATGRANPGN
jgi:multiple sugar transport system ATP-binding protein